jgi:AcrR family transcriptional regulator
MPSTPRRARRPREETVRRREEILRAALTTFGSRGYTNGSLAEIADQVGMTHAGVLHHFRSKDLLLLEVLEYRDRTDVAHLEGQHIPGGLDLFRHLVDTARLNAGRPGIVQAFAVLSAESVTDGHPAKEWFRGRYATLRAEVGSALREVCDPADPPADREVDIAAAAILAVMDGLQVQWLLDPEAVDLARASAFAIDAILSAAVAGHDRRRLLSDARHLDGAERLDDPERADTEG